MKYMTGLEVIWLKQTQTKLLAWIGFFPSPQIISFHHKIENLFVSCIQLSTHGHSFWFGLG